MSEQLHPYLLLKAAQHLFGKSLAELDPQQQSSVLAQAQKESLLQQRILASDEAVGVDVTTDETAQAQQALMQRYPDESSFHAAMQHNQLDDTSLCEALAVQLKVEKVLERVSAQAEPVSEAEISAFYQANIEKFSLPELREARHILITINDDYVENSEQSVRQRIEEIHQQLQADAGQFEALAARHSECPTAMEGGRLGKLPRGKLYDALDAALFSMHEGEISEVLTSPIGLHLLRCDAIEAARTVPLAEAGPTILQHLTDARARAAQSRWIRSLA